MLKCPKQPFVSFVTRATHLALSFVFLKSFLFLSEDSFELGVAGKRSQTEPLDVVHLSSA
jgi:hypothetical protein